MQEVIKGKVQEQEQEVVREVVRKEVQERVQMEVAPEQHQEEMEVERQVEVVEGGQEETVEVRQGSRLPWEEPGGALQVAVDLPSTREELGINQVAGGAALPKRREAPGPIQEAGEEGERAPVVDGEVHRLRLEARPNTCRRLVSGRRPFLTTTAAGL